MTQNRVIFIKIRTKVIIIWVRTMPFSNLHYYTRTLILPVESFDAIAPKNLMIKTVISKFRQIRDR